MYHDHLTQTFFPMFPFEPIKETYNIMKGNVEYVRVHWRSINGKVDLEEEYPARVYDEYYKK